MVRRQYDKESIELMLHRSFAASLQAVLDKNKAIVYQGQAIPQLKDVRGKIVMLNFGNDGRFDQGLQWRKDWQGMPFLGG